MNIMNRTNTKGDFDVTAILRENATLADAVASLRKHNNYLTRRMKLKGHVRTVHYAHDIAMKMALLHCVGFATGRRAMAKEGVSAHGWYHARALLMVSRVHSGCKFTTADPDEIAMALKATVTKLEADPGQFYSRVPTSRRPHAW